MTCTPPVTCHGQEWCTGKPQWWCTGCGAMTCDCGDCYCHACPCPEHEWNAEKET